MDNLDRETLLKNEKDANKNIARGSFVLAAILILIWVGFLTGIFASGPRTLLNVNIAFPIIILLLGATQFYSHTKFVERPGFKYFVMAQFILVMAVINILLPKHGVIGWACCIVLAAHYYNPKIAIITYIAVMVLMLPCLYIGMLTGEWDSNLLGGAGYVTIDGIVYDVDEIGFDLRARFLSQLRDAGDNRYLKCFLYYFLPRGLSITLLGSITYGLTGRSARLLREEAEQVRTNTRLSNELDMAREIQNSVLPTTIGGELDSDFAAMMDPAKEIGGDFYDYFNIDDTHVALVIGDVSGKGVPGALFMMKAEAVIKSLTQSLKENTANIIARSNVALCDNNKAEMFVTCWLGIFDLSTGELRYTNAGHNNPILIKYEEVTYLSGKHGLVLGAMEKATYVENSIFLHKGEKIVLYTDGVTEAHNDKTELFGELRLLEYTKNNKNLEPTLFISSLRDEIKNFAGGREQFDDITMLMFEFHKGVSFAESRVFKADTSELDNLFDYSSSLLKLLNFSGKDIIMINTALEEVFVNVAKYAYEGTGEVEVSLSNDKNKVNFIFKDKGKKFNPLEKEDPNINASSDEREVGGLGIYMVKNIMDEVRYEYKDNSNILTLVKYRK